MFYFGTDACFLFLSFKEYPLIAGLYSDVDSRGADGVGGAVWFRSVVDPDAVPRGAAIRYHIRFVHEIKVTARKIITKSCHSKIEAAKKAGSLLVLANFLA